MTYVFRHPNIFIHNNYVLGHQQIFVHYCLFRTTDILTIFRRPNMYTHCSVLIY